MANFYELKTTDGVSVMVNLESICAIFEDGDVVKTVHADGLSFDFNKDEFMAAMAGSESGYFKYGPVEDTTEEVTE